MKKTYVAPYAEKIEFDYTQQVVASAGGHGANCFPVAIGVGSNQAGDDVTCVSGVRWTK